MLMLYKGAPVPISVFSEGHKQPSSGMGVTEKERKKNYFPFLKKSLKRVAISNSFVEAINEIPESFQKVPD